VKGDTMKKMAFIILIFLILPFVSSENNDFKVHLFWSDGCPHCEDEKEYLNEIKDNYPGMEIIMYNATGSIEEYNLLKEFCDAYNVTFITPIIFIGNECVPGYVSKETTGLEIKKKLDYCLEHGCIDPMDKVKGMGEMTKEKAVEISKNDPLVQDLLKEFPNASSEVDIGEEIYTVKWVAKNRTVYVDIDLKGNILDSREEKTELISIPFIGKIDPSEISLPILTIVIGGLDGFNPCAIWVLCFLLTLLIYVRDRKRMLVVGVIFVSTSAFVYFLFMTAWLNFFLLIGYVDIVRIVIGIVAVTAGIVNMKDFFFFKRGISLTIPESKKPGLIKRMRNLIKEESMVPLIIGTITLAFFANLIELLCSAGFPAIYTRILTLNALPSIQYYLYLVAYNIIYVIPLLVIVMVFVITMGRRKLNERQGRILKLISGALMLILGLLLLLKPEILIVG
jgi:cytochrome c biogenesis protein CcdA/thiol-disulfide isomerase/thioredoxin